MSIVKPFNFRSGTRARSNEVNEDFDVLYSQVNINQADIGELDLRIQDLDDTKAEINGSSSQRFAVADPLNRTDAINLGTLSKQMGNVKRYIEGMRIIKDSASPKDTIIVTIGSCYDSKLEIIINIPSDVKKKNEVQASNTTYYVHAIADKTGNLHDVLISSQQTEPPLPIGYTAYRCIGYFETDNEGNIKYINYFSNTYTQPVKKIDGKSGIIINDDGWCKQWGVVNIGHDQTKEITLKQKYRDTDYLCLGCQRWAYSQGEDAGVGVYPKDNGIVYVRNGGYQGDITWVTEGFIE